MEAGKINISGIFNRTRILKIPYFQRSYVWREDQWERFLDDMKYASRSLTPYFMGSIILKQEETTSDRQTGDIRTIIDGQQRLTTIILFFKALYTKNKKPEKFFDVFLTHNEEIILEHNYQDKPIFDKIIQDKDLDASDKKDSIYKCYKYFLKNIEENEIDQNKLLGNVSFVGIDIQKEEDEQQIFDTINSLGIRLTTAELLKNYFFKKDYDSFEKNWLRVFEVNKDIKKYWDQSVTSGRNIRTNIDLFLQAYFLIKIQNKKINVSAEDKERYFKIDSLFNSYKEFIKKYDINVDNIVDELKEYAHIYKKIIDPDIVNQTIDKNDPIQRLNLIIFGLDTVTVIPYVLYIAKEVTDTDEQIKIFKYLESYIARRIICKNTTKNYNQLFRSLINNEINSLSKLKDIIDKKADVINHMPTDSEVQEGFISSQLTNRQARGILYLVERSIRNEELHATELRFLNDYSLEHVMPKKWRNNWDFDHSLTEEEKNEIDKKILTLGNLTILTKKLNSSIRDSSWKIKKSGNRKNKGLNEYAQSIETFSRYLQYDRWDQGVIEERAKELYDFVISNVWKLD